MPAFIRRPTFILLALLGIPLLLAAQRAGATLVAGYESLEGSDFDAADPGLVLGAELWYAPWRKLEVGIGLTRGTHDIPGADHAVNLVIYAEPRWTFPIRESIAVATLGVRAGFALQSYTQQGFEIAATGFACGGDAGFRVRVGHGVALTLIGSYTHLTLGDFTLAGAPVGNSDTQGDALALLAGVTIRLRR